MKALGLRRAAATLISSIVLAAPALAAATTINGALAAGGLASVDVYAVKCLGPSRFLRVSGEDVGAQPTVLLLTVTGLAPKGKIGGKTLQAASGPGNLVALPDLDRGSPGSMEAHVTASAVSADPVNSYNITIECLAANGASKAVKITTVQDQ